MIKMLMEWLNFHSLTQTLELLGNEHLCLIWHYIIRSGSIRSWYGTVGMRGAYIPPHNQQFQAFYRDQIRVKLSILYLNFLSDS